MLHFKKELKKLYMGREMCVASKQKMKTGTPVCPALQHRETMLFAFELGHCLRAVLFFWGRFSE
jgi:hypothetical protein